MDEPVITQQRIREVAYLLWEAAGKPEGSANRYWEQAEEWLRNEAATPASDMAALDTPNEPTTTASR